MPRQFKSASKLDEPVTVVCALSDCFYYEGLVDKRSDRCRCSHPEKVHYIVGGVCPLYKIDWMKQLRAKQSK
jgi:hypothetical protein